MMIVRHSIQRSLVGARCLHRSAFCFNEYRDRKKELLTEDYKQHYPVLRDVSKDYDEKLRVSSFISQYKSTDFSQYADNEAPETINIQGRIRNIRKSGNSLIFVDLVQDFKRVQIIASCNRMNLDKQQFQATHAILKKNDYINCIGRPTVSKKGELSLKLILPMTLLSPCLNSMKLPDNNQFVHKKVVNSNKVMNYLINKEAKEKILIKNLLIKNIRKFFDQRDFIEFQTPMLHGETTGANAKPFRSESAHVEEPLQLRVAPELWLKKLVISGFEKIFEIGYSFRNEGIDATHNPEFTSCEFYQSFTDLEELMVITQDFFKFLYSEFEKEQNSIELLSTILPQLRPLNEEFRRFEFLPTLEAKAGVPLPTELNSKNLVDYHLQLGLKVPLIKSPASLLDNLSSIYLESICDEYPNTPIFIYNHPSELSPLSKSTTIRYGERSYDISLRYELFINGKEYINAYEEENCPVDQLEKFKQQQLSKNDFNDAEALIPDWNYLKALEFGLPPTGGWGCGIDRLAMLFSGSERIDEVLPFGNLRDVLKN